MDEPYGCSHLPRYQARNDPTHVGVVDEPVKGWGADASGGYRDHGRSVTITRETDLHPSLFNLCAKTDAPGFMVARNDDERFFVSLGECEGLTDSLIEVDHFIQHQGGIRVMSRVVHLGPLNEQEETVGRSFLEFFDGQMGDGGQIQASRGASLVETFFGQKC